MATYASWVPGYSVVAQDMDGSVLDPGSRAFSDVNGYREGFGVSFSLRTDRQNWFHVALPTPVIVEDRRAGLGRVMVLFSCPQRLAALKSVHVWDGPNRILQRDGLSVDGDHSRGLDASNVWDVNQGAIAFGVGISILFSCGLDSQIAFSGAGGDFFYNN